MAAIPAEYRAQRYRLLDGGHSTDTMKDINLDEALALLEASPVALLITGAGGEVRGFNRAFALLLDEKGSVSLDHVQHDSSLAPLLGPERAVNWIMPDGDARWLKVERIALGDTTGMSAHFYHDITEKLRIRRERDALAAELRELSLRDERLPSLFSQHGILVSLEPLVARSRRYNCPLSVVVMGINTRNTGQPIRAAVAAVLKNQTRWADLIGCNNQHDFILVLQESTQDSALQLINKLSSQLAVTNTGLPEPVRASYGITQCQKNDNAASLLERAESALVEARSNDSGTAIAI
ncbi:MAG: diguanylate cyclase [Gammaproteobacteria bacterium]